MVRGDGVEKPRKFKIHFNRINMQRGNPNVWTVHLSDRCIQVEEVVVTGSIRTRFNKDGAQPRAYLYGTGHVRVQGKTALVEAA